MKEDNHFFAGLLLGGVAAAVTALLMAPKSGKELCSDIADTYNNVAEKTENFTEDLKHKSWHILHPSESCASCDKSSSSFGMGAAAGAILGIASAFLLAPKTGGQLRKDIQKTFQEAVDQGEDVKDGIGDIIHKLQSTFSSKGKNSSSSPLTSILEFANMGLHVWNNIQKRK